MHDSNSGLICCISLVFSLAVKGTYDQGEEISVTSTDSCTPRYPFDCLGNFERFLLADLHAFNEDNNGCHLLQTEAECISSKDGRPEYRDSPCEWCCDDNCTVDSGHRCQPRKWLLKHSNHSGGSRNGFGIDTCPPRAPSPPSPAWQTDRDNAALCPEGTKIKSQEACKLAGEALGLTWKSAGWYGGDQEYCWSPSYDHTGFYFNQAPPESTYQVNEEPAAKHNFASICQKAAERQPRYMTDLGEYCDIGHDVKDEKDCFEVAKTLNLDFGYVFNGPNEHKHCWFASDGRNQVFFNEVPATQARQTPYVNFRSLCHEAVTPEGIDVNENSKPAWVDLDEDGDMDLVIGARDGKLQYYEHRDDSSLVLRKDDANPFKDIDIGSNAAPVFVDWNKNGYLDLVIGSEEGALWYYERMEDNSWKVLTGNANPFNGTDVDSNAVPVFVDWDEDGNLDLIIGNGDGKLWYYQCTGENSLSQPITGESNPFEGIDVGRNAVPLFVDWDKDGDLDLIVGNNDGVLKYYESTRGAGNTHFFLLQPNTQNPFHGIDVGTEAAPTVVDWDMNAKELLAIGNGNGGLPSYNRIRRRANWIERPDTTNPFRGIAVGSTAAPAVVDWNNDKYLDLIIGNDDGGLLYYESVGGEILPRTGNANPFRGINVGGASRPAVMDWDGDVDLDLVVGNEEGELWYYEQQEDKGLLLRTGHGNPFHGLNVSGRAAPAIADCNRDGYLDIVIGNEAGELSYYEGTGVKGSVRQRTGNSNPFERLQLKRKSVGLTLRKQATPAFVDWDNDGDLDLAVGNSDGELDFFFCEGEDFYLTPGSSNPFEKLKLKDASKPAFADWDGDHDLDLIIGGMKAQQGKDGIAYYLNGCEQRSSCNNRGECRTSGNCSCSEGYLESPDCGVCDPGWYRSSTADRSIECRGCPAGKYSAAYGANCSECPAGSYSQKFALSCSTCPEGTYVDFAGATACIPCAKGRYQSERGSHACLACSFLLQPNHRQNRCSVNPPVLVHIILYVLVVFHLVDCFCRALVHKFKIIDVSWRGGRMLVTTYGAHLLQNYFFRPSFPITVRGTKHPLLDSGKDSQVCRAKYVSGMELELLNADGDPVMEILDASNGFLSLQFKDMFLHTSSWPLLGVPTVISAIMMLIAALVLGFLCTATPFTIIVITAATMFCSCALRVCYEQYFRRALTPLARRLIRFNALLSKDNPTPKPCPRGPGRAIRIDKLLSLLEFFRDFIRDRNAYYLNANITVPITERHKLSYAEVVGPSPVTFFVSHYWGTPFDHFCATLRKHAESTTCDPEVADEIVLKGNCPPLRNFAYWICFCSNNQHDIKSELGGDMGWQQSSFYLALHSPSCHSTCMILDDFAIPLTRSWCIFETLQALHISQTRTTFHLQLCTSTGVLNYGNGSIEAAMGIVKAVARMDLQNAQASSQEDKDMIDGLVMQQMGSFDKLNDFVRDNIHEVLETAQQRCSSEFAELFSLLENVRSTGDPLGIVERLKSDPVKSSVSHYTNTEPNSFSHVSTPNDGVESGMSKKSKMSIVLI